MLNEKILRNDEKAVLALRSLYRRFGYSRYKMSKFEEYDLYVRNKDFLISDGIITFNDTDGKLLALKPDVTLSIIKNTKDEKGTVQKLYYNENVYRIAKDSHCFREINQTGLECIGDIDIHDICEVLYLALKSLETIDENYIIDIAHAGLLEALFSGEALEGETKKKVIAHIQNKSIDEIRIMKNEGAISDRAFTLACTLTKNYRTFRDLAEALGQCDGEAAENLTEFGKMFDSLARLNLTDKVRIDFSIVSDTGYYSGLVFKGYIAGIPTGVLSGGQYDKLMRKMGKACCAVGFAVYLDALERHGRETADYDFDFVIIKDDTADIAELIKTTESLSENGFSVIVLREKPENIKYRNLIKFTKDGLEGV